jgi:glucans biosynthesis protein
MAPGLRRFAALYVMGLCCAACACSNVAESPGEPKVNSASQTSWAHTAGLEGVARASEAARVAAPPAFFEHVREEARSLAEKPAAALPQIRLPPELQRLSYDAYREIRFRPEHSLWRGEPGNFEVQFFHPGRGYIHPVAVSVVEGGTQKEPGVEKPVPFTTDWFSYEGLPGPPPAQGLAFTGLRIHAPLNQKSYRDEVLAFQGASYFRPLGQGNVYGISARGLAIDLGEPRPEEFPVFTHFYLVRPGASDDALWVLALLESKRCTGAYAFHVRPGSPTVIDVTASVFARDSIAALGLAPLTSMFLFGEEEPNRFGDFRPEVHDSDGLSFWSGSGEWLFRPLRNPRRTVASTFRLDAPHGFGLLQRDRNFDHYQDLEARYQQRPSIWVEPVAGFERGSLRLLEIADKTETGDNIASAWMPEGGVRAGQRLDVSYRLRVGTEVAPGPPGRVLATRMGKTQHGVRFLVDFSGNALAGDAALQAVVSSSGGRVIEQHLERNAYAEGWRASFEVSPESSRGVELRAFLQAKNAAHDVLTETWSYLWQPN